MSGDGSWAALGLEELSYADLAAILSDVIGRRVAYVHLTYEAYKKASMARGQTDAFAQGYVDMLRAKEAGMDNMASRASAIIGATGFRQRAEEELRPAVVE